jgi:hypothetical protein
LNDDLTTVMLRRDVLESPPVTIWPALCRRAPLPDDVEVFLSHFDTRANQAAAADQRRAGRGVDCETGERRSRLSGRALDG